MSNLTYSSSKGVGIVELNSPPANTYGADLMRELDAVVQDIEADNGCRVVIVRSALEKFFCGGADIKRFYENRPRDNIEMIGVAHETLSKLARSEKMYIAEIGGHALSGGLEIALACDLRFAAKGNYRLGLPEVALGIIPGNGGTQRLAALVGASRALELMALATSLTPEEAFRMGIVNRLYETADLRDQTMSVATSLANSATLAVGKIKRAIYDGYCHSLESGLAIERRNIATLFNSADAREGFAAFVERRKPKFAGR